MRIVLGEKGISLIEECRYYFKNISIHYDPLMMSYKEAPRKQPWVHPRKVAKMVWISVQFSFVEYDGCFLGASYYVLAVAEGNTQEAPVIIY